MLRISRVAGGQRNITLHVTGVLKGELELTPIDLEDEELQGKFDVKQAKLASLVWVIQEKLGLRLWWNEETPLLPMESRNAARFDNPIQPPKGWDGKLWLSSYHFDTEPRADEKWFFFTLDFDR